MFFQEPELQYEVTVEEPDPHFAKLLQQAIGGQEGEMRVAMQYMFQAWALPEGYEEYRNLLMETAAEELGHIEMLATAVTKNLRGSAKQMSDDAEETAATAAAMTGQNPRQFLSAGESAMPVDSNGVPFTGNYIVASGNLAGDLYANVMSEATGRTLATRLYEYTDDPGMKDMLAYLIARDTMHQNQWLEALESLDDPVPVPASFPQEQENQEYNYAFMSTRREQQPDPGYPWTQGEAPDGKGQFSYLPEQPGDGEVIAPQPSPMTNDTPSRPDDAAAGDSNATGISETTDSKPSDGNATDSNQ
ncbi:manganese catalase family protein [Haloterrigena salifodinae]|uniref:Manganese catalase family protein n=1 Tax=Haloterrigena salifodinae TaxID=2675099 RepID=A0A8T8E6W4_9EURY|nr:manganese catalase family protein [Haloterrigena salifodinae]QRV17363.1 manganese catalase family protein [Haloterrigena salifodinae]